MGFKILILTIILSAACWSCGKQVKAQTAFPKADGVPAPASLEAENRKISEALQKARIPAEMAGRILQNAQSFLGALKPALRGDPALYALVDKNHPLDPPDYEPPDLTVLKNGSYITGRAGLMLRKEAEDALEKMARAARADGVTLVASSAYRSYDYQTVVYERNVRESGRETADRESARPGYSQHQTGLAVDFGSITDDFAGTPAGIWIFKNAPSYGWTISFPDGYEDVTGYRWESWHYRYVGVELAAFITEWFGGIQQYALQFIYEWEKL
ncbi:MAG: M15 family metallopeptidase [Spirochaetaceae bacterium]|nr:M15 family metallopeptidase [Spirochaetaceae bacterium]